MSIENLEQSNIFEFESEKFEVNSEGYINFGDIALSVVNQQSQYASRYVNGAFGEYPNLGEGLRFEGDPDDYHMLEIHKDDVIEFVERVRKHKEGYK